MSCNWRKMHYTATFCFIFCLTSVFCSTSNTSPIVNDTTNGTAESSVISCDDFCRLRYQVNDSVLVLTPGEYQIDADGTLIIDLNNSSLNKTLFKVWSNDSSPRSPDCKIKYGNWNFLLMAISVCIIALQLNMCQVVLCNDSVKQVQYAAYSTSYFLFISVLLAFINPTDCHDTKRAVHVFLQFASLNWVFWRSSGFFESFINQLHLIRMRRGGINNDIILWGMLKNLVRNFMGRLMVVTAFSCLLVVNGFPWIGQYVSECGVPYVTMYLTFTPFVIAYVVVIVANFAVYRKYLATTELNGEAMRIFKDLCDLDFMFFVILAFTWLVGCFLPAGYDFVYYTNLVELCTLLAFLLNFMRYCHTLDWRGAFV